MNPLPAGSIDPAAPSLRGDPASRRVNPDLNTAAYQPPRWLGNRHLQTIWPVVVPTGPRVKYRRERWVTPDHDFIDLDWALADPEHTPGAPTANGPLVALFHGLEGSSGSHSSRAIMADLLAIGWRGVVVHWRGCSGEPNLLARAYHSGDSAEVDWIMRKLRPDFVAGVSLGGNALLKWLGEQGAQAGFVKAAAGISAPQDLQAGAIALSRGFNRVYSWAFLSSLKRKSALKLDAFPGLYDRRRLMAARNFFDFDELVTAPLHGFASATDYWQRSSCKQYLGGIAVPTLVLNARNDPFLPERMLARPAEVSAAVVLDYPADGGHVGFVLGSPPGHVEWLPRRLIDFFRQFN